MSVPFLPGGGNAHNRKKCTPGGVLVATALLLLWSAGLASAAAPGAGAFKERLVWALNVGGGAFESWVGETYAADDCTTGAARCGSLSDVARTQNSLYRSYRIGAQRYRKALPAGLYDVVLYFVEPSAVDGEARRFDVLIEGRTMLADLNLLAMKNGQAAAAVTRALPAVAVRDGYLDIELVSGTDDPVLAGLLVRQSRFTTDGWEQVWADEFDGDGLDTRSWSVETWPARFVNDEDQAYTAQQKNVRTVNGHWYSKHIMRGPPILPIPRAGFTRRVNAVCITAASTCVRAYPRGAVSGPPSGFCRRTRSVTQPIAVRRQANGRAMQTATPGPIRER